LAGWFYGILNKYLVAISCLKQFIKFISKAIGVHERNYSFRVNIMEEIFEIISSTEMSIR